MRFKFLILVLFTAKLLPAQVIYTSEHKLKFIAQVSCTPVKDQALSSTCWSFATNSFIESELLRMGKPETDISEMFTARMAWIQKINLHLKLKGKNCLTPGGQFHNVQWAAANYGMVPQSVYDGKPSGETTYNHEKLDTLLTRYVAKMLKQKKTTPTETDWQYINSVLDKYLGKLPSSFSIEGKSYTPKTYLENYLGIHPDAYMEITSYTHHPFYKRFVLENKYNFTSSPYMNVPLTDFFAITDSALLHGYSVLWNGDVEDAGFNFTNGSAYLTDSVNLSKVRQQRFEDSTSSLDHVMHIVGLLKDENGHKWYYIKNSWGTFNALGGYMLMDENYFAINTAAIVVNKEAIPLPISKKMK